VSLHIALSGLHLSRPSWRSLGRSMAPVGVAGVVVVAEAAGCGFHALTLLLGAVGAWKVTDRYWQRRYQRFAAAVDAGNRAIHEQLARLEREAVERFDAEVADRNGRWLALNEPRRVGVS
jgi:hypothetical protein